MTCVASSPGGTSHTGALLSAKIALLSSVETLAGTWTSRFSRISGFWFSVCETDVSTWCGYVALSISRLTSHPADLQCWPRNMQPFTVEPETTQRYIDKSPAFLKFGTKHLIQDTIFGSGLYTGRFPALEPGSSQ